MDIGNQLAWTPFLTWAALFFFFQAKSQMNPSKMA